jgi:outer membrane protein OmpA-like peptidoglycan-associated protein
VQFRTGETLVRDNDRARIAKLGALVSGLPNVRVRVSGFADSRGGDEINQTLSQERADYRGARTGEGGACPRTA